MFASAHVDCPYGRWVPPVGGGIGHPNISTSSFSVGDFRSDVLNRGVFGWQAKAGLAYGIDHNQDIDAEGVYQGAGSDDSNDDSGDVHVGAVNPWGDKLDFRYRFALRLNVLVEQPAPAPEPAPDPEPVDEPGPRVAASGAPLEECWSHPEFDASDSGPRPAVFSCSPRDGETLLHNREHP